MCRENKTQILFQICLSQQKKKSYSPFGTDAEDLISKPRAQIPSSSCCVVGAQLNPSRARAWWLIRSTSSSLWIWSFHVFSPIMEATVPLLLVPSSVSTVSRVCRVRFRVCSLDHPPLQFSLLDSCSFSTRLFHYQTPGCGLREWPPGGGCITGYEWGSDSLQTVVQNACQGALVASNLLQVGYSSSFYVLLSGWCKGRWCHPSPDHQVWQKVRKALPWYQEADTLQRAFVMRAFSPVHTCIPTRPESSRKLQGEIAAQWLSSSVLRQKHQTVCLGMNLGYSNVAFWVLLLCLHHHSKKKAQQKERQRDRE